jgi:hypothetical protein
MSVQGSLFLSEMERQEFEDFFETLVEDVVTSPEFADMPEVNERLRRILHYNVPHGKRARFKSRPFKSHFPKFS